MINDTICAPATAMGGAIGIIRVSGEQAIEIASSIFSSDLTKAQPNNVIFGRILSPPPVGGGQGEAIDEVLVSVFRAPHSYTGEDSVEISCHGSRYILNKVLELLVQQGCRMANPGEFTQRAFLNGKMDLSQAEAVADLIASTNKVTHQIALSQLRGGISSELAVLREKLLKLTSLLELELDFSDHEDLEFADRCELLELAKNIDRKVTNLAQSFEVGQAIKNGVPVAIVGKTNVGKSTLLNRLLRDDRAIVSDIHGTTRDTIEDTGITFRFIDTAGLRETTDTVEKIGIKRTYAAIEKAQIVLWVIDQEPTESELQEILEQIKYKTLIIIQNKVDLEPQNSDKNRSNFNYQLSTINYQLLNISAKTGEGIEALETAIYEAANIPSITENDVIISSARHYDALTRAHEHLQRVLDGMTMELSGDLLAEDLRLTLDTLSDITGGQITTHEVLGNIFTHFCVGK